MSVELPDLPYSRSDLEPHISEETINYHYGKHHAGYVKKLNAAIEGTELDELSLEEIVKTATGGNFNNAAQIWNHTFYWNSLSPSGGGAPSGGLADAIATSFGSFEDFVSLFNKSAGGNFGSGWTWLVKNQDGRLEIVNTSNADTPLTDESLTPILTVDVWEHAYYVDYRNDRGGYLTKFWQLVNWEFAASNFAA